MIIKVQRVKLIEALTKKLEAVKADFQTKMTEYEAAVAAQQAYLRKAALAAVTSPEFNSADTLVVRMPLGSQMGVRLEIPVPNLIPPPLMARPSIPRVQSSRSRWDTVPLTEILQQWISQLEVSGEEELKLKDTDPLISYL